MSLLPTKDKPRAKSASSSDIADTDTSMKDLYARDGASTVKKTKAAGGKAKAYTESYRVLVRPLITEKATRAGAQHKYVFAVFPNATKIMVALAIEDVYGVKPVQVNISNVSGKRKRTGRIVGRRSDWKKAVVSLPQGTTIQVYEGV